MFKPNPYRPGAGLMPMYLAGRDESIQEIDEMFQTINAGMPTQSVIISGLRGVGKTVLINKLQALAEEKNIFCKHIEVEERNDFISQIVACSKAFLRSVSSKEKFKHLIKKPLEAIKSLVISFNPEESTFSLSLQEQELYKSTNLTQSLTDVFTALGETALKTNTPICFFIDEIQYMKKDELNSLISALHRANQLGYPIMMVSAGLPKIYKMLSDVKSYAERLFVYKEIGSLDEKSVISAITEPAKQLNVSYTDEAVHKIAETTKGYPFFIQQFCQIIYQKDTDKVVELKDVENSISEFYKVLDEGFFKVRYERCSESDKRFIFAMVKCKSLPCNISAVAKNMNKNVTSISALRAKLINKGIIYSKGFSELDFTVPEFSNYIKRNEAYKQWNEKYFSESSKEHKYRPKISYDDIER